MHVRLCAGTRTCFFAVFAPLLLPWLAPAVATAQPAQLVSVRKIWDNAPHNAFTDLVRHDGTWYCSFREATMHGVTVSGSIRVLRSTDGEDWTSAVLLTSETEDLRDPHLVITPDNRLMLYAAVVTPSPVDGVTHRNFVWFSSDGTSWTERVEIGEPNIWIWRITWHDGVAYGIGYAWMNSVFLRLYRSTDGVHFTTHVPNMGATGTVNETSRIHFMPDGTAYVLARDKAWGRSAPPYTEWTWIPTSATVGGPEVIRLPDSRFVAVTRLYNGTVRTGVSWLDPATGGLSECLTLPSGGDTSYAGLVWHEDLLWVSYYSSHEVRTCIYLAKVAFPQQQLLSISDTFTREPSDSPGFTEQPQLPWVERGTLGQDADVAGIQGEQMLITGVDGSSPGSTGPGSVILNADLPNLAASTDVRFLLDNPTPLFGNNTAGFMLRKPRLDANIGHDSSLGQITVQLHPSGGLFIGERIAGSTVTLYADNPFVDGPQEMSALNVFAGAGSLPATLSGAPFDVDADGILESAEPFRLTVQLSGTTLEVRINGQTVATVTTQRASSTPSNYFALLKNRWTSSAGGAPSHVMYDNLQISIAGVSDACGDAAWIADGVTRGTIAGATNDGAASCTTYPGPDIWYRYSPPIAGDLLVNLCEADFGAVVSVLTECGGQELGCSVGCPGGACAGASACVRVPVSASQAVLVRVGSAAGGTGSYAMNVRTVPPSVMVHRGQSDPEAETPPFSLDTSASAAERTLEPGSDAQPHWRIAAAANRRANYQYPLSPQHWSDPSGWTFTAHLRAVAAAGLFQCYIELNDSQDVWALNMVTGGTLAPGLWTVGSNLQADQPLAAFDPGAGYHTIQIVFDPAGDGGNGLARYYMDGALLGTQTRAQAPDRALKRIVWGDNVSSGSSASDSHWAYVRFEPGQHPTPPCPAIAPDVDGDLDVDLDDFGAFQACYGPDVDVSETCVCFDLVRDGRVDAADFAAFVRCARGPAIPADPECD